MEEGKLYYRTCKADSGLSLEDERFRQDVDVLGEVGLGRGEGVGPVEVWVRNPLRTAHGFDPV